jgi:hypothetical protein
VLYAWCDVVSGASDIGKGSTLGGYFQIVKDPNNEGNGATAHFQNITIISAVPEPFVFALIGLSIASMAVRRRRR